MNKTFAALALAGLSFSPVAQAATKTYLKSVIDTNDRKTAAVWQVTVDLEKLTSDTSATKDNVKGTYKKISLSTGKASTGRGNVTTIESLMGGVALDVADEVASFPSDSASVFKLVADQAEDLAIQNAVAKADAAAAAKRKAAEAKVETTTKAYASAFGARSALADQVAATQSDFYTAMENIRANGASDLAAAIEAVYLGEDKLNKDTPGLAVLDGDGTTIPVVKKSSATKLIDLKADLAKAKKEKRSTEALDQQIEAETKTSADAKKELDDLKKELKAAQDTFTKELAKTILSPEQVAGVKASVTQLGKFRTTWLGYASKVKKANALFEKTGKDVTAAEEAVASIDAQIWKVTHSFLSVSQSGSAASTKSVVAVLQRPGGKAITYNGPGCTAAGNVFAVGTSGYVVGFDGTTKTVNSYPVFAEVSGTAASSLSTDDVADSLVQSDVTVLGKSTTVYKVVNGKVLTYATKLDPDGTEAYVVGNQLTNKLTLKLGLVSGSFGKDSVVGIVGTFDGVNKAYANELEYIKLQ